MPDKPPMVITSLACLQCGRALGSFARTQGRAWPATVRFHPAGSDVDCDANPQLIRCSACNGTAIVDDEAVERGRAPERVDWPEPRRRGRPPSAERTELRERRAAQRRLVSAEVASI